MVFTDCLFRRPIKKAATAPAVKLEEGSDAETWIATQQSMGKSQRRLGSPVVVSSDESGPKGLSDTPRVKGRPSRTNPKALENQR